MASSWRFSLARSPPTACTSAPWFCAWRWRAQYTAELAQALAHASDRAKRWARLAGQHLDPGPQTQALQQWLLQLEQQRYAPATAQAAARQRLAALRREFRQLAWPHS